MSFAFWETVTAVATTHLCLMEEKTMEMTNILRVKDVAMSWKISCCVYFCATVLNVDMLTVKLSEHTTSSANSVASGCN